MLFDVLIMVAAWQGDGEDSWWCERCQQNSSVEWRYILSAQVSDHTGSHWLTAFQVGVDT